MTTLTFDARTTKILDDAYQGADVGRRRLANLEALAPRDGDVVVDIGCGPGLLALELSRAVGERGTVIGIDPSADMRETAARRCEDRSNVRILDGRADRLPIDDGAADKAVSVQVFEYLDDIPAALAEVRRVLRPGGRVVIGDVHWDSLVWSSGEPSRMALMVDIWDGHLVERAVPALLPGLLAEAGLVVEAVQPVTITDTTLRPDGLARMLMHLMAAFAIRRSAIGEGDARAWADEQQQLADQGRFFFSLTHFIVAARRA